jgi:hypothetical protein
VADRGSVGHGGLLANRRRLVDEMFWLGLRFWQDPEITIGIIEGIVAADLNWARIFCTVVKLQSQ